MSFPFPSGKLMNASHVLIGVLLSETKGSPCLKENVVIFLFVVLMREKVALSESI